MATSTVTPKQFTADQIEQLWIEAGGPPNVAPLMAALAIQQSTGNPAAHNAPTKNGGHEDSRGLWQINVMAHPQYANEDLFDALTNAKAAVAIYKQDGVSPWGYVPVNDSDPYGKAKENPVIAAWNAAGGDKAKAAQDALTVAMQEQGMSTAIPAADITPSSLTAADTSTVDQTASATTSAANDVLTGKGGSGSVPAVGPNGIGSATTAQLAGDSNIPAVAMPTYQPYTGPNAYKGFDLSALSPNLRPEAQQAIDEYLSNPQLEQRMFSDIEYNYGSESWGMNDPQIRTLLVVATILDWGKDPNLFIDQLNRTAWYLRQSDNQRAAEQLQANNPGQWQAALQQAQARVIDDANELGAQLTGAAVARIANIVALNSVDESGAYSATAMSDQQINQLVASEFRASQLTSSVADAANAVTGTEGAETASAPLNTPQPGTRITGPNGESLTPSVASAEQAVAVPGPITGTEPGGIAAELYNQFQTLAKEYYLPLNNSQIAQQVQKYVDSYSGQPDFKTGALQGFEAFAKQMALNLYPALRGILGTSDASGASPQTPYSALQGYRTLIANYTGYNGDPDTINLGSPQWSWILTGSGPPSQKTAAPGSSPPSTSSTANTNPALPTYDAVQKYLMQQPAYQSTDAAKTQAWQVASAILKSFGYGG